VCSLCAGACQLKRVMFLCSLCPFYRLLIKNVSVFIVCFFIAFFSLFCCFLFAVS